MQKMEKLKAKISEADIKRIVRHVFGKKETVLSARPLRGGLFNALYKLRLKAVGTIVLRAGVSKNKSCAVSASELLKKESV